jgi:hypothetical protein
LDFFLPKRTDIGKDDDDILSSIVASILPQYRVATTFDGIGIHRLEGVRQQLGGMTPVDAPAPPPRAAAADEMPQLSLNLISFGSNIYNSTIFSNYVGDLDPNNTLPPSQEVDYGGPPKDRSLLPALFAYTACLSYLPDVS